MILDLELSEHLWKRLAGIKLSDTDLRSFDDAAYFSMNKLARIDEEGAEGLHGGDLAGDGGSCVLALVEVSKEIEDELSVDRLHVGSVATVGAVVGSGLPGGGEAREAGEIVSIGVDGVLGGAAFGGQVVQELFYSIQH